MIKMMMILLILITGCLHATERHIGPGEVIDLRATTIPATGKAGQIRYDTSANVLKYYNGTGWATADETLSIVSKSSAYTATAADDLIKGDASGGAFSIALPSITGITGKILSIQKTDTSYNTIELNPDGAETINGNATTKISTQYEQVDIVANGSEWLIINRKIPEETATCTVTISWSGAGMVNQAKCSRHGDKLRVHGRVTIGAGGISSGTTFTVDIPSGLTFDGAKHPTGSVSAEAPLLGNAAMLDIGTTYYPYAVPRFVDSNTVDFVVLFDQTGSATNYIAGSAVSNTVPFSFGNTDWIEYHFEAPITDWNGE